MSEPKFYLLKNNQQFGAYTESEVRDLIKNEQFTLNNLACREGMNQWMPLGNLLKFERADLPKSSSDGLMSQITIIEVGIFFVILIGISVIFTIIFSLIAGKPVVGFPGFGGIFLAAAAAGWVVNLRLKRKMEKTLGRKLRGDMEMNSLSTWMEINEKNKNGR